MPDLVPQRASAPVLGSAQRGVQLEFQRLVKVDQSFEMCPTQLSPQCVDNFLIGKNLGETDYVEGIRSGEPSSVLRRQLFRQCRNNLVVVARPLLVEHIFADALADLPVHVDQRGIDGAGRLFAGCLDQLTDFQAPLPGLFWVPADSLLKEW